MDKKIKITIEGDVDTLLAFLFGDAAVAVASEGDGEGDNTIPDSSTGGAPEDGEGSDNNNNNGNTTGDKENTGRPGGGTGLLGPTRP